MNKFRYNKINEEIIFTESIYKAIIETQFTKDLESLSIDCKPEDVINWAKKTKSKYQHFGKYFKQTQSDFGLGFFYLKRFGVFEKLPYLCKTKDKWSHRLMVRTLGFHPRNRSSILRGTTKVGCCYK